jgi:hypothetical protein
MDFLFSLLNMKDLYMFQVLLVYPYEALGILCVCYVSLLLPVSSWNQSLVTPSPLCDSILVEINPYATELNPVCN